MKLENKFPITLLQSIYKTVENARNYVRKRERNIPLHYQLREASETLNSMIRTGQESEQPFWYTLYEGLISKYIQLRTDLRDVKAQNTMLRRENSELKEKYWDLVERAKQLEAEAGLY